MRHTALGRNVFLVIFVGMAASVALAEDEIDRPPIAYSRSTPNNDVSELVSRLESGELQLKHEQDVGYLRGLLKALDVPFESQVLVFSKTSLQRDRISPRTPRAVYFNDDVYIGYCQSGDVLEVSVADPQLGAVFYTVDQKKIDRPHVLRQTDSCLLCHSSSRTDGVPGHLVRSVFVDPSGQPIFSAGSFSVDHTTPFENRWGGWYVTGKHGAQSHLGNLVIRGRDVPQPVENAQGQNVTDLKDRLAVEKYLTPHSDLVALLVLEHQVLIHNRITKANYATRQALHYDAEMRKVLETPAGQRLDSTNSRIRSAGDDLVKALLLVDEAKLTSSISGTSGFAEQFSRKGPRDSQGRSLRDLDLKGRLFKYPCSYLIYSKSFGELPPEMREYVWKRLWDVLTPAEGVEGFTTHISREDRQAIVEILCGTRTDLPAYWATANRR